MSPVTGIIYTASPFVFAIKDNVTDLLTPAIDGSTAVLKAIQRYGAKLDVFFYSCRRFDSKLTARLYLHKERLGPIDV